MTNLELAYFEWLCNIVQRKGYENLLLYLYQTTFYWTIPMDENRALDGLALRNRFGEDIGTDCNVLEMMVALSIRMEDTFLFDPEYDDRTHIWFWDMIISLGLNSQDDEHFNEKTVRTKIDIFLSRMYKPNGEGGLFTVDNSAYNLSRVEIWYQMNWHISDILQSLQEEG